MHNFPAKCLISDGYEEVHHGYLCNLGALTVVRSAIAGFVRRSRREALCDWNYRFGLSSSQVPSASSQNTSIRFIVLICGTDLPDLPSGKGHSNTFQDLIPKALNPKASIPTVNLNPTLNHNPTTPPLLRPLSIPSRKPTLHKFTAFALAAREVQVQDYDACI